MSIKMTTHRPTSRMQWLVLLFVSAIFAAIAGYSFSRSALFARLATTKLIYSQSALLSETWSTYKSSYIEAGSGRTIDSHATNDTTSLAESETMLRSVWIDDKATFDASWQWSQKNEQLDTKLFASAYGPRADGLYGFVNTATDSQADSQIALALLMAYSRWNDPKDLTDGEAVVNALYQNSVVIANGSPVMADSSVDTDAASVATSPAAFTVYAYKEFAKVDPSHDWTGLVNSTYDLYGRMIALGNGQLPNGATIDLTTGDVTVSQAGKVFGADSATGVWNLGFDYAWNHDARDLALMRQLPYAAQYRTSGTILTAGQQSVATYGKLMPYVEAVDPSLAPSYFSDTLASQYSQDEQSWATNLDNGDATWAWLGIGQRDGQLRMLTEDAS